MDLSLYIFSNESSLKYTIILHIKNFTFLKIIFIIYKK